MLRPSLVDQLTLILSETNDEHSVVITSNLDKINMFYSVYLCDVLLGLQELVLCWIFFSFLCVCWSQFYDGFDFDYQVLRNYKNGRLLLLYAVLWRQFCVRMWVSLVIFDELDVLVDLEHIIELGNIELVIELWDHGNPEGMEFIVRTNDVINFIE